MYDISNEITLRVPPRGRSFTSGDTWVDPIIGARVRHALSESWTTSLRAEVGGFGINADVVWQLYGLVGYRINESSILYAGWRHAAVDYQNGGFLYDVASSGPIIGYAYQF